MKQIQETAKLFATKCKEGTSDPDELEKLDLALAKTKELELHLEYIAGLLRKLDKT